MLGACPRSLVFGSTATVEQYKGNPRVQVHGPGFSKILLGDDKVDQWEKYLDLMVDSVLVNSGRGCINCSGIWGSRHTREIAQALAERMGPVQPLPPDDPKSALAKVCSRAGSTRSVFQSNSARFVFVPPMSPARIIHSS